MAGQSADRRKRRTGTGKAATRDLRLGFLIHDVSRLRRRAFDSFMREIGVTRAQWWIVAHLSRQDGVTQSALADILDVGKASLGSVIDRLEAAGLAKRRADAQDRRAKRICLTRKARQLLTKMRAAEKRYNKVVLAGLTARDRDLLLDLLSRVRRALVQLETRRS